MNLVYKYPVTENWNIYNKTARDANDIKGNPGTRTGTTGRGDTAAQEMSPGPREGGGVINSTSTTFLHPHSQPSSPTDKLHVRLRNGYAGTFNRQGELCFLSFEAVVPWLFPPRSRFCPPITPLTCELPGVSIVPSSKPQKSD